ncbi:pantothenate synthetase [Gammaproteobacteria bacterium]
MFQIVDTISDLHKILALWQNQTIAFVPTMGNLHAGHMALVRHARTLAERVVVSIFVNPIQFGPGEDYASYPRTLDLDALKLAAEKVDLLFTPSSKEIYPSEKKLATTVNVSGLSDILCGATRPGHFSGVATVVTLLLNLIQPQVAIFGEKDFQQLLVIRRLVADLFLPVKIVGYPTVRESDGLAMSSRNGYLNTQERKQAPCLYRALRKMCDNLVTEMNDYIKLEDICWKELSEAGFKPEYCTVRRVLDLAVPNIEDRQLVVLAAARLGKTRLIDNVQVTL